MYFGQIVVGTKGTSFEPLWRKAYEKPLDVAQRMVEWLEGRAIKKADAVFAPSRKIAVEVERALNLNVKVIEPPFLLDTRNLDLSVYQQNLKGKSYLLFYGTIGLLKGCKTIADILEPLLVRNPGLYFVFIGKTLGYRSRSMIEYILERAGSVRHRVIHFEPLHHETLYPIIKNARAVVLPSRIDNFPNTCIEAMYFGQIVVGTKGTSFEQLIQHGKSGFLCFPDNPNSLLETIVKVLTLSQNERNAVSQNAKRQVERLDYEKVTQNLIKFYEHTIQERAQRVKR
jgi:glycosyltransferase involved in cell wall biosynthesis